MKLKDKLIKQLAAGEIGIIYSYSNCSKDLNDVMSAAAGGDPMYYTGTSKFYWFDLSKGPQHSDNNAAGLRVYPLSAFFEKEDEFKNGEEVEVSQSADFSNSAVQPFIGMHPYSGFFVTANNSVFTTVWKYCRRPIKKVTIALEDLIAVYAEHKNISPESIEVHTT